MNGEKKYKLMEKICLYLLRWQMERENMLLMLYRKVNQCKELLKAVLYLVMRWDYYYLYLILRFRFLFCYYEIEIKIKKGSLNVQS